MFVQVIRGKVADKDRLKAVIDRWERDLAAGAQGWLGTTAGVTDDGTALAVVRFESQDAAQRNSDRTEQGEWWAEAAQAFEGDVDFANSDNVEVRTPGDPAEAGFVQVMTGRGSDPDRARQLYLDNSDAIYALRPEILGNVMVGHPDGRFTMVTYFTDEGAAREGERKEMPDSLRQQMVELDSLLEAEPDYHDLRDPWLSAP